MALLAAPALARAYLPRGVAQQRGLPASRGADDRQYHRVWMVQEFAEGPALGDVGRQVRQQSFLDQVRRPGRQADVNVDVVQFRGEGADCGEALLIDEAQAREDEGPVVPVEPGDSALQGEVQAVGKPLLPALRNVSYDTARKPRHRDHCLIGHEPHRDRDVVCGKLPPNP